MRRGDAVAQWSSVVPEGGYPAQRLEPVRKTAGEVDRVHRHEHGQRDAGHRPRAVKGPARELRRTGEEQRQRPHAHRARDDQPERDMRSRDPSGDERHRPVIARIVTATTAATMKEPTTQLRLITRRAYGFRTPEALIALALLSLGGLCPLLPV